MNLLFSGLLFFALVAAEAATLENTRLYGKVESWDQKSVILRIEGGLVSVPRKALKKSDLKEGKAVAAYLGGGLLGELKVLPKR